MHTIIKSLNNEQRYWYACILAKAAQADDVVHLHGINFFYHAFFFLDDKSRKEILHMLKTKKIPDNVFKSIPNGLSKKHLADIFGDVIKLICANGSISDNERHILKKISDFFGFSDDFYEDMLQWSENVENVEKDYQNLMNHHSEKY